MADLDACIDLIESSYEYMLAYAAQGRDNEAGGTGPSIRATLENLSAALGDITSYFDLDDYSEAMRPFFAFAGQDVVRARAAVNFALAAPNISSQLVDNLNASMHLRTLLTDLFLIDEALKAVKRGG
ncbi:MAG: hypothetical protein SFV21_02040 [Rhodospirillaceae bacterium]|nr:hypothetical protein [Rhodospirillaceae bacterium]